jgi:hypothetical protein
MENQDPVVEENLDPNLNVDSGDEVQEEVVVSKNWFDELDPDLKNHPSITKFKDPKGLAKSYVELQKMIGKDKIAIPNEKSTPQEWSEFYQKVGRPDEMTGYEAPDIEMPEEIKMRAESLEAFKAKAHELGLTKKQFAELYALQSEITQTTFNQQVEEAQKMKENTETELRKEWGAAFDKKIDSAQKLINTFFKGKELHKAFTVLSNDRGFVSAMSDIAEKLGEDNISGTSRMTMTPKEAQSSMNQMLGDTKNPLHDDLHPEHQAAVEKFTELSRMANNG